MQFSYFLFQLLYGSCLSYVHVYPWRMKTMLGGEHRGTLTLDLTEGCRGIRAVGEICLKSEARKSSHAGTML